MAETKTVQKGWRFSPETVQQLEALCKKEKRSEQNMVEVLIDRAFVEIESVKVFGHIVNHSNLANVSRTPDASS
jgi:uncharacterized Fe-S cluster-containing protein